MDMREEETEEETRKEENEDPIDMDALPKKQKKRLRG